MGVKISKIITPSDWIKIGILLAVSIVCWVWVYQEYQKPAFAESKDWSNQGLAE